MLLVETLKVRLDEIAAEIEMGENHVVQLLAAAPKNATRKQLLRNVHFRPDFWTWDNE